MSEAQSDSVETQGPVLTDVDSSLGLAQDSVKGDHCDLLLDAMDRQLDQLQIQSHKGHRMFRDDGSTEADTVWCGWSQSVSKDTGLGSTHTDTPLSCQDLRTDTPLFCRDLQTPEDHMSDSSTGSKSSPGQSRVPGRRWSRSRAQEQTLWRLQRLLGQHCEDGVLAPPQVPAPPLSDSVCTEDFSQRFSQEMVREPLSHRGASAGGAKALHQEGGAGLSGGHVCSHGEPPRRSTSTPKSKCKAGWRSFMESVQSLDEPWGRLGHDDRATLGESEGFPGKPLAAPHLRGESRRPTVDEDNELEETEDQRNTEGKQWAELRERLCSLQQRLEEAHEDSESSLRNKCASLEEQHRRDGHKLQCYESQVCELQGALQACQLTVGTLEKVLSEKELQLLDLQKLHAEVQAQKEQLEARLQQMKSQHRSALREAREQAHSALQTALEQHKKNLDLQHRREVHKDQQRAVEELKHSEAEVTRLRKTLEERERTHSQSTADGQHRAKQWALDLLTEVGLLQGTVHQHSNTSPEHNRDSPTVEEALSALRTTREQVQSFSEDLHEDLRSVRNITEQLLEDKERELSVQKQQLQRERDLALDSLIQEHVEELSCLRSEGPAQAMLACLRSQLQAKDRELRQVQRSMARWKENTAEKMARKYEEELTAELERWKTKLLKCRTVLKTHEELTGPAVSKEELDAKERAPPLYAVDRTSDTASLMLLRHLQVKVKQLRSHSAPHSPGTATAPPHN